MISRAGFDPIKRKVDLVIGRTTDLDETLKVATRFGTIKLVFPSGGWGDIYFKGAKVGRAPMTALKLPVGKQILHLKNTGRKPDIEWNVSCDVDDAVVNVCKTAVPL